MSDAADRVLTKLDEASRKMDELHAAIRRYRNEAPSRAFTAFWLGLVPGAAIFIAGMLFLV